MNEPWLRVRAYAKVNLALYLGGVREDGRHDLVTLFESVDLADELVVSEAGADTVVCPGVPGPNLVADALGGLRELGWTAPPVLVEVIKQIPVAAGMGGGSADAAALLRVAGELGSVPAEGVAALAARLGSDVPSQLDPGPVLGLGAGDIVRRLPDPGPHALLVVPQSFGLATADVYRASDDLGRGRNKTELLAMQVALELATAQPGWVLPGAQIINELQAAALTLRPELARVLAAVKGAGAQRAIVCGSGPTVIGVFGGEDGAERSAVACASLSDRYPGAVAVRPILRGVGAAAANS